MEITLAHFYTVSPFSGFGLTNSFFNLNLDTIAFTWLAMIILFAGVYIVRRYCFTEKSLLYTAVEYMVEGFAGLTAQTIGYMRVDYFSFITSMFAFTFTTCVVSLLPYVEEAARDPNTTFALSFSSFFYIVYQSVRQDGLLNYLSHYLGHELMPMPVRIIMSPIETMGQLSKIISMSFRLFGNVLGGGIVLQVLVSFVMLGKEYFLWAVLIGSLIWLIVFKLLGSASDEGIGKPISRMIQLLFVLADAQLFFGVFEALVQSFVVAMLSITYLSLAIHHNAKEDERGLSWQQ